MSISTVTNSIIKGIDVNNEIIKLISDTSYDFVSEYMNECNRKNINNYIRDTSIVNYIINKRFNALIQNIEKYADNNDISKSILSRVIEITSKTSWIKKQTEVAADYGLRYYISIRDNPDYIVDFVFHSIDGFMYIHKLMEKLDKDISHNLFIDILEKLVDANKFTAINSISSDSNFVSYLENNHTLAHKALCILNNDHVDTGGVCDFNAINYSKKIGKSYSHIMYCDVKYKNSTDIYDIIDIMKDELIGDIDNNRYKVKYNIDKSDITYGIDNYITHIKGKGERNRRNKNQISCVLSKIVNCDRNERNSFMIDMAIASNHCYSRKNEFTNHYYIIYVLGGSNTKAEHIKMIIKESFIYYSKLIAIELSYKHDSSDVHYYNSMFYVIGLDSISDSTSTHIYDDLIDHYNNRFKLDECRNVFVDIMKQRDIEPSVISDILLSIIGNKRCEISYIDYCRTILLQKISTIINMEEDEIEKINKDIEKLETETVNRIYIDSRMRNTISTEIYKQLIDYAVE